MLKTQKLSLPMLVSLVVGNMIGTGIFLLPSSLAKFGSLAIISWIFAGLGALFLALTFANLNKKIPQSGGPYVYCKKAYGNFIGFLVAYLYWISLWITTAGVAVASIGYLDVILKSFGEHAQTIYHPYMTFLIEAGAIWLFTFINIIGVRAAGFTQIVLTVLKLSPLLIICAVGLFKMNLHNLAQFNISDQPFFPAMTSAAILTMWAFLGLETATIPAENAQNTNHVFRATVYGTLITAIIYIICTIVLMGLIPPMQLKNLSFPFAAAASMLFGHNMAYVIAVCAIISGLGTLNVGILTQAQIPYAAARDQLFPTMFAKLTRFGTPMISQIISSILATILLLLTLNSKLVNQFNMLALLATFITLATYAMCTLAELKLLVQNSAEFNARHLIKSVIITVLAGAFAAWMMFGADKMTIFYGLALLGSSVPVYFWIAFKYKASIRDDTVPAYNP